MQPMLGAPSDVLERLALSALTHYPRRTEIGAIAIDPHRFDCDAAHVGVARLADRAARDPSAAGVLSEDLAGIAHQLSSAAKARELSELTDQGHGRDLGESAQTLQPPDHRLRSRMALAVRG